MKNFTFLLQQILKLENRGQALPQIFRKMSFLGRRAMIDIRTSRNALAPILNFYTLSLELLSKDLVREVC